MGDIGGSTTYFVSRHHEHPPATLEELLRVSSKPDSISKKTDSADVIRKRVPDADDADSDSDYQCGSEDSDGDIDSGEPKQDEWRLHAAEPREGLYLHEMRRQRGRMDEKEAEWVRGYIKAQRAWKTRTGRSIDEFHIPNSFTRRMKKSPSVKGNPSSKSLTREQQEQEQEQEGDASLLVRLTRLETIFLVAAVVFVCLSLVVQVYVSVTSEQETMVE